MSTDKLALNKFRIARLNGIENIIGGNKTKKTEPPPAGTELDPPKQVVCIKTSQEYIDLNETHDPH